MSDDGSDADADADADPDVGTDADSDADTDASHDADLDDDRVEELVAWLAPEWTIEDLTRSDAGTDFVAILDLRPPDGPRRAVLKATTAGLVDPPIARSEPRLLDLVGAETSIPVPNVIASCERHEDVPAPFYLLEYVAGENYEGRIASIDAVHRERICRDAGRQLAALHELGPLPTAGRIGVADDELAVLDTDDHPSYDDGRDWLLASCETTLDALERGGWFPELADDPERFVDLVPELRRYVREAVPALPEPNSPTYCHTDYRYGNLLVDPDTGATRAVLDWANCSSAPPAYNLANAESLLLTPDRDSAERTAELRDAFRSAYAAERDGWRFDEPTREWLRLSHFASRLAAMAAMPLWYEDATLARRDERAAEHREFVAEFL